MKLETFIQPHLKTNLPEIRAGDVVRVHQKIKEGDPSTNAGQTKERIQVFEGLVLGAKHGKGLEGTITVRKVSEGVGVERIFPLHSPLIEKIELVKRAKVRRAKLSYLRLAKGKRAKLKAGELGIALAQETPQETPAQEPAAEPAEANTK